MPGSPRTTSVPLRPPRTESSSESSTSHSCIRPTSVTNEDPRGIVAASIPVAARSQPQNGISVTPDADWSVPNLLPRREQRIPAYEATLGPVRAEPNEGRLAVEVLALLLENRAVVPAIRPERVVGGRLTGLPQRNRCHERWKGDD